MSEQDLFYELTYYTLSHQSKDFIHQHVVDAFTAQNATKSTKPIAVYFALAGLYLTLEKKYSGKEVQNAHILFSKKTKKFPLLCLPDSRGKIRVNQVLAASPGPDRDTLIKQWCQSVWEAYKSEQEKVTVFTESLLK